MSELREVRSTHPYAFRSGEWARVLTTVESYGKPCWLVEFPDCKQDWWAIEDADADPKCRGCKYRFLGRLKGGRCRACRAWRKVG